jgi:hypothetical protein
MSQHEASKVLNYWSTEWNGTEASFGNTILHLKNRHDADCSSEVRHFRFVVQSLHYLLNLAGPTSVWDVDYHGSVLLSRVG